MFTFFSPTIQIAKKPAIKAMKAATPPFATTEPAADEEVEEEAAVVAEEGEEAPDAPLVRELAVGTEALDPPMAVVPPMTPVTPVPVTPTTLVPLAALNAEDAATEALTLPEVNGTGLGVALGPVGLRPAAEQTWFCNMTAFWRSVGPQFVAIQPPASAWN